MPPVHPIDQSGLAGYVTSPRIRYTLSSAYSSKLNPRNLEVDYYPAYNHTLADLVDFQLDGALVVAPQHNLWLSKATFDLCKVPSEYFTADGDDDDEDNEVVEGVDEDLFAGGIPSPPVSSSPPRARVESGRPKRDIKPPPSYPKDFLTSIRAIAALTPSEELTQAELNRALGNLAILSTLSREPSDATEADTSMTTMATVPDGQGKDLFPDFLLCHSYAVEVDRPGDEKAVFGWERRARCKVQHQCFPLIMEIKGCPARASRGDKMAAQRAYALDAAAVELHDYVQAYFARDVCAKSVIAMVASGPYWRWELIERNEVGRKVPYQGLPVSTPTDSALLKSSFLDKLKEAPIFILSTNASDKELTRLRNDFLIPLIEDHYRYPSTVVANPQRPKKSDNTAS